MPSERTQWAPFIAVLVSAIVAAMQVGKAAIGLPDLAEDLRLGLGSAAWVVSVFAVVGVVGAVPVGLAVGRFGGKRPVLAGLSAMALGSFAGGMAESFPTLLAARAMEGAGFLLVVVAAPVLSQMLAAPKDRKMVMAIWSTFMPAGMAIALAAGTLIGGWRSMWLAGAGLTVVSAGLLAFAVPDSAPRGRVAPSQALADLRAAVAAGKPPVLALLFTVYSVQFFAVFSFLPTLLSERMGISLAAAGGLSAAAAAANIGGNLLAGAVLTRGHAPWKLLLAANLVIGAAAAAVFSGGPSPAAAFGICLVFSAVGGIVPATILAEAAVGSERSQALSMGLVMQGNNLGQVVGPALIGAVVQTVGWPGASIAVAVAAVVGLALTVLTRSPPRLAMPG